jgi:hypothetical protein
MRINEEALVPVQLEWNAWKVAEVRFGDLEDIHWLQPSGAPRPLLHAFVRPAKVACVSLPNHPDADVMPERLRVCVLKCHTIAETYLALASRAYAPGAA